MKPSDTSFLGESSIPGWLATLARQLRDGGAQAPPETLSPVSLLQELLAITGSMASGHSAPRGEDPKSLKADILASLGSLGPVSATLHKTAVGDFRKQVERLPALLADLAGAQSLRAHARVLLDELTADESRIAAFQDCVAAFESGEFVGVCETRVRYLRTVLEASGHDWLERAGYLLEALAGRDSALLRFGALSPPHLEVEFRDEAGLSTDERLVLCHTILTAKPRSGRVIVWLCYASASISKWHLQRGPVEFYDGRIWPAVLADNWSGNPTWQQPEELKESNARLFLGGIPEKDFVMVRATLEDVPVAEARRRGRELARAALELIGWDSDWVLMNGEAAYASSWFGTTQFTDPREEAVRLADLTTMTDPAADALAQLEPELLQRIADSEEAALELVADTRWRRSVAHLPDQEHRISLAVALFERALVPSSVGTDKWYGACKHYFEALLAFDDVLGQIKDAGFYGVQALRRTPQGQSQFVTFEQGIIEHTGRFSFNVRLDEVMRLAPTLRPHLEAGSMEARMLAEVEQHTQDGVAAAHWLNMAFRRVSCLLARARRQRNAITHGTRTVPDVVESVEPFLNKIAGQLIGARHYCVVKDLDLTTELQAWRLLRLKRRDQLAGGGSPDLLIS